MLTHSKAMAASSQQRQVLASSVVVGVATDAADVPVFLTFYSGVVFV